ncbi:ankyrin repeat-containing protein BDA1-like [Durio zibethinus]|uniref:Ankyrin repeat-containing protein BDA1-like n=1 Tax=Durio zibethinus TaxID=66656 RepID=A0A6P5Z608_DURZI|nr:ankyrin repeat-containing protein BDA1-like [Durio zibethinus]
MDLSEKLREGAQEGNIDGLYAIIREDPCILELIDQVPFVDTPLHVAVAAGNDDFAMEIMNLKPSFARKLNKDGYSPIHLALQNEKSVLRLLAADKSLVRVEGREGYTPLHWVAAQGNLRLLAQFLVDCPECVQDGTIRNETALHVAAKSNNKLEALQVLTRSLRRTYFYSSSFGEKALELEGQRWQHCAALLMENGLKTCWNLTVAILDSPFGAIAYSKVNINEINSSGMTALDVIQELPVLEQSAKRKAMDILLNAEGLSTSSIPRAQTLHELLGSKITFLERAFSEVFYDITNMSAERSSAVLVILVQIPTSTYQATLSPPGGMLQGDGSDCVCKQTNSTNSNGGKSVLSSASFLLFYVPNTIAFIMTLILTLGLPAIIASGISSLLLVPLLLLYFCLLSSTFDISPNSAVVIFGFLPLLSLPVMLRVIGHAKCLKKYMVEEV